MDFFIGRLLFSFGNFVDMHKARAIEERPKKGSKGIFKIPLEPSYWQLPYYPLHILSLLERLFF
jgi:hypothetical protein